MPNVTVVISRAQAGRRAASPRGNTEVVTDKDGNFRGAGLSPGLYEVDVLRVKEYVMRPLTAAESRERRYYRVGDSVTITLVKGGVITGRVTNSDGQPMVGVGVSATMIRDAEGYSARDAPEGDPRMTDDRGIYRIYGLRPGSYIVGTSGEMSDAYFSPYAGSAMTYHPSSTHDTAAEVAVVSGAEANGIDIQFRGGPGYVVSSDDPSALASSASHFFGSDAVINEKGEFAIHSLRPSRYHFEASLPDENWYTRSITIPSPAADRQPQAGLNLRDISRAGLEIKSGDKVTGVTVTVAEGAAGLSGKVVAEKKGASLPSRLRVHLAPVDAALANEILRYAEVFMRNDGSFAFNNLAPGKYWLLARPVPDDEPVDRPPRPLSWDSAERARLRIDAEKKKIEVELKPCQRLKDFSFKF
jgi:hypothetical protein